MYLILHIYWYDCRLDYSPYSQCHQHDSLQIQRLRQRPPSTLAVELAPKAAALIAVAVAPLPTAVEY